MTHVTVTCRCTRPMSQEPGRRAGYLACGCGNKVRLDDVQHSVCHVRSKDGEPCDRSPVMTRPIALCSRHIMVLARTEPFMRHGVTEEQRKEWGRLEQRQDAEIVRQDKMRRARWDVEDRLRQEQLAEQSVVYYIARGHDIKIGFTTNMRERMSALMPDAVLATEPGGRALEKRRHRQFDHLRTAIGREYFQAVPELLTHIETVLAEQGPPKITGYPKYHTWHLGDHMLVSVKEAARLALVPVRTMHLWVREGRLTVVMPAERTRGALVNALEAQELAALRKDGKLPRLDSAKSLR